MGFTPTTAVRGTLPRIGRDKDEEAAGSDEAGPASGPVADLRENGSIKFAGLSLSRSSAMDCEVARRFEPMPSIPKYCKPICE